MGTHTVRYAHLESLPKWKVGQLIRPHDIIGKMGNTGQSDGAHLHIDVINGYTSELYKLQEMGCTNKYTPNIEQLNYFIDYALFRSEYKISTYFGDPRYLKTYNKPHYGYDIFPTAGYSFWDIYWNRTKMGHVLKTGYAENSYGYYIIIGFET